MVVLAAETMQKPSDERFLETLGFWRDPKAQEKHSMAQGKMKCDLEYNLQTRLAGEQHSDIG